MTDQGEMITSMTWQTISRRKPFWPRLWARLTRGDQYESECLKITVKASVPCIIYAVQAVRSEVDGRAA